MAVPDEITADGFDKQMQTNHLAHFLLTRELFPLLLASAKEHGDARIVEHSSIARDGTKTKTTDHGLEERYFSKQEKDGLAVHLQKEGMVAKLVGAIFSTLVMQSAQDGAMGLIKCMMDARDNVQGGMLYGPGGKGFSGAPVAIPPQLHEADQQAKDMLWTTSEAATGVSFEV